MQNHARGMVLSNNGKIGTQGGSLAPSDNQWSASTTWTGTTNGTYVDLSSTASLSILYVKAASTYTPPNPGGPSPNTYALTTNTPTTTGAYSCGGGGGGGSGRYANNTPGRSVYSHNQLNITSSLRTVGGQNELSDELKYIEAFNEYKAFDGNDSLRNSDTSNINYYNSMSNTSIGKFVQAEKYIYAGQIGAAIALKSTVTPTNSVESNYVKFYDLYNNYKQDNISENDISDLEALSNLCPGKDGSVIFQARALYNVITKSVFAFNENCSGDQVNLRQITQSNTAANAYSWDVHLFPNPTLGELNVLSKTDSENLELSVKDVSGKVIYKNSLAISGFIGKLDLDLANGVYFITVSNQNNESITKKLVITK